MKRIATGVLFGVLALGICATANSQPGGAMGRPGPAMQQQLSPEQLEQAKRIFQESYKDMEATRQALAAKRAELDSLLYSPNPDKAKIETLSREIGELRGKMLAARVETREKLQQNDLPENIYGPDQPMRRGYGPRPEVWQGGRHWHGHRRPHGGWGCPGMMGPCGNW